MNIKKVWFGIFLSLALAMSVFSQKNQQPESQEVSEVDGVPVIFKNLPDSVNAQKRAILVKDLPSLKKAIGERSVLNILGFEGGAEAAVADYDKTKIVIYEHNSPQVAFETDAKVNQKLAELGQNRDFFYRKEGNYALFAFDSPDQETANALFDQIKYGKSIQWLGDNPFQFKVAERIYVETAGGVIVAVFQATGIAVLVAIFVGGFFGYLVFKRRRKESEKIYSDAGGMMRLNLDELTPSITKNLLKD